MSDASDKIRAIYERFHAARSADRQDILRNRGALLQTQANEAALYRALGRIDFSPDWKIIDIGGSSGGSLVPFMAARARLDRLTSVDIQPGFAEAGRLRFPAVHFITSDARSLPFDEETFDLAQFATVFYQMPDIEMARGVAREVCRVVRSGGYIIAREWAFANPRDKDTRAVTRAYIERLFDLPIVLIERGAIVSPIGRRCPEWLYAVLRPLLSAGRVYVLKVQH